MRDAADICDQKLDACHAMSRGLEDVPRPKLRSAPGPYKLNSIIAGDAKDLLAELPEACIDLTVTSPLYDDLRDYKGYSFRFKSIASELFRAARPGGTVVWVVGDATKNFCESLTSFKQAIYFVEVCGFNLLDTMLYLCE